MILQTSSTKAPAQRVCSEQTVVQTNKICVGISGGGRARRERGPRDGFPFHLFGYHTHTRMHVHTRTDICALAKRQSTPTEERTIKHTKTDLEPVKCEQTDDKTATDGFTEERRATHSTQLATSCCMTPMGYGILP